MGHCPDCGTRRPYRGLTDDQIDEIRERRAAGEHLLPLAKSYGISYGMVRRVIKGEDKVCRSCALRRSWRNPSVKQQGAREIARAHAAELGRRNRGRKASDGTREKMRRARAGKKPALGMQHSEETKRHLSHLMRNANRPVSEAERRRRSAAAHRRWGTTPRPGIPRNDLAAWAHKVIKRDGGRCRVCDTPKRGPKSIQAHHILSKSKHPEFALLVNNGITLCAPCHRAEHTINGNI